MISGICSSLLPHCLLCFSLLSFLFFFLIALSLSPSQALYCFSLSPLVAHIIHAVSPQCIGTVMYMSYLRSRQDFLFVTFCIINHWPVWFCFFILWCLQCVFEGLFFCIYLFNLMPCSHLPPHLPIPYTLSLTLICSPLCSTSYIPMTIYPPSSSDLSPPTADLFGDVGQ